MGDKGFEVDEFGLPNELLPDNLLDDFMVPLNKQESNMLRDKLNLSIPRTPGPTGSLSYQNKVNNDFFVPSLPLCPIFPEKPWAMASPNQSALNALNPVVGSGRALIPWPNQSALNALNPVVGSGRALIPSPNQSALNALNPMMGRGRALVPSPPIAPIGRRNTAYNQVKNSGSQGQIRNFGPISPPNPLPNPMNGIMWGPRQVGGQFGTGVFDVTPRMAWGGPQFQNQRWSIGGVQMGPVGYGSGLKRECVGTGVFFPRRCYNTTPEPRKKTGGSTAQPPPRGVQAQNRSKNKNKKSRNVQSQRRFVRGGQISANGSEPAAARMNAANAPERRKSEPVKKTSNGAAGASAQEARVRNEIRLPHEWNY